MHTNANFLKMIALAESVFDARHDPEQLDVNEEVMNKLHALHPACLSEYNEGDGPLVWILLIPVTHEVMQAFLKKEISEKELFEQTMPGQNFSAIYLCSALVLPEHRMKGLAKKTSLEAIRKIRESFPIQDLFVWPFSEEGSKLAEGIAREVGIPLHKRST